MHYFVFSCFIKEDAADHGAGHSHEDYEEANPASGLRYTLYKNSMFCFLVNKLLCLGQQITLFELLS